MENERSCPPSENWVPRELYAKAAKERDEAVAQLKESVPLDEHFEQMIISAERYAFGRRTYIISDTCDYILSLIPRLSVWCLNVMWQDIKSEIESSERSNSMQNWGDECDRQQRTSFWKRITEEIERRTSNDQTT